MKGLNSTPSILVPCLLCTPFNESLCIIEASQMAYAFVSFSSCKSQTNLSHLRRRYRLGVRSSDSLHSDVCSATYQLCDCGQGIFFIIINKSITYVSLSPYCPLTPYLCVGEVSNLSVLCTLLTKMVRQYIYFA